MEGCNNKMYKLKAVCLNGGAVLIESFVYKTCLNE